MFKFIDRHPFISGFIIGYIVFGRGLKKLIDSKLTIIKVVMSDDKVLSKEKESTETKEN